MIMALCWHFVNVRHVTFWVSSGLPSLPSLFLPLIQFSIFFSSLARFILLLFLLHLYPCFFFPITSAILYFILFLPPLLWPNNIMFSTPVMSTFLSPFIAIHKLLQNILGWLPHFLAYPLISWLFYTILKVVGILNIGNFNQFSYTSSVKTLSSIWQCLYGEVF